MFASLIEQAAARETGRSKKRNGVTHGYRNDAHWEFRSTGYHW
jgi:hypothetical protein